MTKPLLRFIQETGFAFELDQVETGSRVDLLCRIEDSCLRALLDKGTECECIQIRWKGFDLLVWYCVIGADIWLRSIVSAYP